MMRLWECVSAEYGLLQSLQGIFGTKTLAAPKHVQDQGWGCLPSQGVL